MFQHKIVDLDNIVIACPSCNTKLGHIIITSTGDVHATPDLLPVFKCIVELKEYIILCKTCSRFFGLLIGSNKEIEVKKN